MKELAKRYFVSFPAAIVTLTVIGLFSMYGTVALEGDASMAFFKQWPFTLVMCVFMLQLIVAVLTRWPWRLSHTGWIVVHTGLVVICIGHILTRQGHIEGTVDLFEGQQTDHIDQQGMWLLTADLPDLGRRVRIKLPLAELEEAPDTPIQKGPFVLPSGDALTVERFFPTFEVRTRVVPVASDAPPFHPAYRLELSSGRGAPLSTWVFRGGDGHQHAPVAFNTAAGLRIAALYRQVPGRAGLEQLLDLGAIEVQGKGVSVPVVEALSRATVLAGTGVSVRVLRRFTRMRLDTRKQKPFDALEGEPNPALELLLKKGDIEERRWIFATHPEASTPGEGKLGFTLRYRIPEGAAERVATFAQSSVTLVARADQPDKTILVVSDGEGHVQVTSFVPTRQVALRWLGRASVAITDLLPNAREIEEPFCASYQSNRPAVLVSVKRDGKVIDRGWVRWNGEQTPTVLTGSSGKIKLRYNTRTVELGFKIRLEDFVLETHEGTSMPRSFESFVRLIPDFKAFVLLNEHRVPPIDGGPSGDRFADLQIASPGGLESGTVLRVETPRGFYYAEIQSIDPGKQGRAVVRVENIGRPGTLPAKTRIPAQSRAQELYHIYMNHPLTHKGYTFFQSSYDPKTLRRSIFQVTTDPGWKTVYLGYALLVLGLLLVVYIKPYFVRREATRRARVALARIEAEKKAKAAENGAAPTV